VALAVTVRLKDRPHSVRRKFGGRKQVGDKSPNEPPSAWREVDEASMVQSKQRYPEICDSLRRFDDEVAQITVRVKIESMQTA
jgi:hypothetical protein